MTIQVQTIAVPPGSGVPPAGPGAVVSPNGQGAPNPAAPPVPTFIPAPTQPLNIPHPDNAPPAPAPAPAPTPADATLEALRAAAAKEAAAKPKTSENLNNFDISTIEDPGMRSVATSFSHLANLGKIDVNRALGKALERGDPSLIDEAYIKELSPEHAAAMLSLGATLVQGANTAADTLTASVYATAGGEAQWTAAATAFSASASAEFKQLVATALESGDAKQVKAAAATVVKYAQDNGLVIKQGVQIAPGSAAPGGHSLSKEDFKAAVAQLDTKARDYPQKLQDLSRLRKQGVALGRR